MASCAAARVLFLSLLFLLPIPSRAQEPSATGAAPPPVGEKEFESGLKSVNSQMTAGKFKDAQAALHKLLTLHEGRDYARAKRVEIAENLKRCAFRVKYPAPEPKSLVMGELLNYETATGRIRIRFKGAASDFVSEKAAKGTSVFPAPFIGTHSIEMKGAEYPSGEVGPLVVCCASDDRGGGYRVIFGYPPASNAPGTRYAPSLIQSFSANGKDADTLVKKEPSPGKVGARYTLKVEASTTSIVATLNGSAFMKATKPADHWGILAYAGVRPDEILIDGKIEPSWMQNKIDAKVAEQLAQFEKDWRPRQEVPTWLDDASPAVKSEGSESRGPSASIFPGGPTKDQLKKAMELAMRINAARAKEIRREIEALSSDALPEATKEFLLFACATEEGDEAKANLHLERAAELDPSYPLFGMVRVERARASGSVDAAIKRQEEAIAAKPDDGNAYATLVYLLLEKNRATDAKKALENGIKAGADRGPHRRSFDQLGRMLDKAVRGPNWAKTFDYKTSHYIVNSDIDRETCAKAAGLLEDALVVYSGRLRSLPAGGPPFRVYLFSGRDSYQRYAHDILGAVQENTAGLYSPILKQLMIWNLPERSEMMRTCLHEGFHQYLDRVCPGEIPTWFNEGSACYYERAAQVNGSWTTGQVDALYADAARKALSKRTFALDEFVYGRRDGFYRNAAESYPLAWSLIHFLRHTTPDRKQVADKFFNALADGKPMKVALNDHFPVSTLEAWEAAFFEHVANLK